jgi:hypothetical protein
VGRKRKTLKERGREAFDRAQTRVEVSNLLPKADYTDERRREIAAAIALTLSDRSADAALRAAFQKFGLDPINPHDWRTLLDVFADIFFEGRPKRKRGRD